MHVVVVGCGRVGSALARSLTEGGHTVAVIDKRPEAFGRLPSDFTGQTIAGIGFDRDRLQEAGIEQAAALAAVTNGDNSNILIARVARETFGIERRRGPHLRPPPGRDLPAARHRHRRHRGVDDRAGAAPHPARARPAVEWIDPSARVSLVERTIAGVVGGPPAVRARGAGAGPGRGRRPPRAWPRSQRPTSSPRRATCVYLAVASDALADVDAALAAGPAKGGH